MYALIVANPMLFLSTLSLRRATAFLCFVVRRGRISIHALLAESDETFSQVVSSELYFYPRSPCGERQIQKIEKDEVQTISIHALLAESDVVCNNRFSFR